jgi:D-3-phosphoglycerate dehydrogenase
VSACDSLDELLESSDLVSLHLPLLPETERLLGAAQFARMRPGALLVNVSRGGLIDEDALADALEAGQIAGAALDVFAREPLAPGARILQAPHTVLSPHIAWFSTASGPTVRRDTVEAMITWIESGTVPNGNLAARPLRPRAGAVTGGVS